MLTICQLYTVLSGHFQSENGILQDIGIFSIQIYTLSYILWMSIPIKRSLTVYWSCLSLVCNVTYDLFMNSFCYIN